MNVLEDLDMCNEYNVAEDLSNLLPTDIAYLRSRYDKACGALRCLCCDKILPDDFEHSICDDCYLEITCVY